MKNPELDQLRFGATEVENHYIDEYMAGNISRQRLLQLGTGIGMSLPLLGMFGTASALASSKCRCLVAYRTNVEYRTAKPRVRGLDETTCDLPHGGEHRWPDADEPVASGRC